MKDVQRVAIRTLWYRSVVSRISCLLPVVSFIGMEGHAHRRLLYSYSHTKKSRAEVVYLEGVLREACQFVTIHFKERMSSSKKNPLTHVLATCNAHEPFLLER